MILSKYFHCKQVDVDKYAIYNSLLMHLAFVDLETLIRIRNLEINDSEEMRSLFDLGIIVESEEMDARALANLKEALENHKKKLSIMYLCVSSYCNLACKYCFIEENPQSTNCRELMSIETAKLAVDKFCAQLDINGEEKPQIIFYGGEPLTNWDLIKEIIPYAINKCPDLQLVVITNGTLLTEEICRFLKRYDVGIGLSLDGPKSINDKNRVFRDGDKSVFDCVSEKVEMLNREGNSYSISATITSDIVTNAQDTLTCFKSIDAKAVFWNLFHYSSPSTDWRAFYSDMSNFILMNSDHLEAMEIPEGRMMELINNFLAGYFRFQSCAAVGLNQIAVQANGDVCVCQGDSRSHQHIIGNITVDTIDNMLSTPEAQRWGNLHTLYREECLQCDSIFACGGGCPLQAEVLFGSRNSLDKASCVFYKRVMDWLILKCYLLSKDDK